MYRGKRSYTRLIIYENNLFSRVRMCDLIKIPSHEVLLHIK